MYLVRNNLPEFSGTKKEIIKYLLDSYEDDYFIQKYGKQLYKNMEALQQVLDFLNLRITQKLPRKRRAK